MNTSHAINFLEATFRKIFPQEYAFRQMAEERLRQSTQPQWPLGDLQDLAVDLAGMTRSLRPPVARKKVVVMVGDHGVSAEGVSRYPAEMTTPMVRAFIRSTAGISALARLGGAEVCVVDVGARDDVADLVRDDRVVAKKIGRGTANMIHGPAMTRTHAVMAVEAGIEVANALAPEVDVLGVGAVGVGGTAPSTAIAAVLTGRKVEELIGRGTGIDDAQLAHRVEVIEKALTRNKPNVKDGLDVLAKVGGFEIGAIAGLLIGAAAHRTPVVVDGFATTAGALIACSLEPFVRDYVICTRRSGEPGHSALLDLLRCRPLFELNLQLGEGSGAALAMHLVEAAAALLADADPGAGAGRDGAV
jgi:nicotinate-nucleotide--dimethylbenzimidazole phosphoribosyltransferase